MCLLSSHASEALCQDDAIRLQIRNPGRAILGAPQPPNPALKEIYKLAPNADNPATLRWNNGESLPGEPSAATATELTWHSPLFEDALVLKWDALRRIDRTLEAIVSEEPFSFSLRDGSHLFGDIVAVSGDAITIRSARHGDAVLKCAEVISARRLKGGNVVTNGPAGESRWHVLTDTARNSAALTTKVPQMRTGAGGALELPYWNRGAMLDVALPELIDAEFRVRSTRGPDFQLSFRASGMHRLSVETWDEDLVLVAGRSFKFLRKLTDADRDVALRICWDRNTQKCTVFTLEGERLVDWDVPFDPGSSDSQVQVQNKGRDLTLELLRVRKWDGKAPAKITGELPRVELADGRAISGTIAGGASGVVTITAGGASAATTHPLSEVEALIFSSDTPREGESGMTLTYADGTLLHGRMVSIADGGVSLDAAFAEGALATRLDGLRQLIRQGGDAPEPALAEWDTLVTPQLTLHGRLASGGDARPRWLPVGGVRPALPKLALEAEIRRAISTPAEVPGAAALFYMSTGDVLPGALRALARDGVEFESSVVEATKLRAESLDAVQFGASGQASVRGFSDPEWRELKGKVRRSGETLDLGIDTAIGHPSALHSSEVQFTLSTGGFGVVRLRLFCAGTEAAKSSNVLVGTMGNRLYWGMEAAEGQFDEQQQINVEQRAPIAVRLVVSEKHVDLHLNGILARKITIPSASRFGGGLVIEPASFWGNPVQPITVKDFSAISGVGRAWLPEVSDDAKLHALTVPRFRQDDPPRHALLGGNGDVLRGEIEAATATHFGFRSGLEELRVPRDRVRAAIWLKPPNRNAPPPEAASTMAKRLGQRLTRRTRYSGAGLASLTAYLQREVGGLKIGLPVHDRNMRVAMQFGGQTVAEALEEICTLFGMHYRVEGDTVLIGAASQVEGEFGAKVYWLKPSAFPADDSAQMILAGKGVPFTDKASVVWDAATGYLTVTDAPATQAKLRAVLEAEFGGAVESPTHWLLLTDGARLGFAVEKFEADAVTGRHPAYGRCRVPVARIQTIRTTAPEPTPAMRSLSNWRLTYAPEPVLPETGGESSPTLGKAAKPFKLPLLEGGEFDLAAAKGKVVVLDFWATWCGPCVKALPMLIETMSNFPSESVVFVGVNQSEPAEQVKRFLEARGWTFPVALDAGQKVGRLYEVEGIPHTVIVGPDGNVAWVKTGFSPDGAAKAAEVVKKLLAPAR